MNTTTENSPVVLPVLSRSGYEITMPPGYGLEICPDEHHHINPDDDFQPYSTHPNFGKFEGGNDLYTSIIKRIDNVTEYSEFNPIYLTYDLDQTRSEVWGWKAHNFTPALKQIRRGFVRGIIREQFKWLQDESHYDSKDLEEAMYSFYYNCKNGYDVYLSNRVREVFTYTMDVNVLSPEELKEKLKQALILIVEACYESLEGFQEVVEFYMHTSEASFPHFVNFKHAATNYYELAQVMMRDIVDSYPHIFPLDLYDHSGYSVTAADSGLFNRGGRGCRWDSSNNFALVIANDYEAAKRSAQYWEDCLNGDFYGAIISTVDADGLETVIDSCWGFAGSNHGDSGLFDFVKEVVK